VTTSCPVRRLHEVHVIGSRDLVQSLLRFGLVDRLDLWLYPLLLGSGKQVFAGETAPAGPPQRHYTQPAGSTP
jgi:dihydrofolate reductase